MLLYMSITQCVPLMSKSVVFITERGRREERDDL